MPSNKQITLHCPEVIKDWMEEALRFYADAAHPPGGSECSMVARDSLLTAANNIHEQQNSFIISRRLKPKLKAAINYYFENKRNNTGVSYDNAHQLTLAVLNGKVVTSSELRLASDKDALELQ